MPAAAAKTGMALLLILFFGTPAGPAAEDTARHQLRVELFPHRQQLQVTDHITIDKNTGDRLIFRLSRRAEQIEVAVNGKSREYDFTDGRLRIALLADEKNQTIQVTIGYTAIFDDPVPRRPANADNPGYGVSATITANGSFLLAGSGWYPLWTGGHSIYALKVIAPRGMLAVTAGRSQGHLTQNGKSVSAWYVNDPIRGLSLSVGPYVVRQANAGNITAATYFLPQTDHLADAYLQATLKYLTLYQDLFGPYAYDKFAVVENFFPTGFGFPSYTLIGGSVLRLPFIIHTSLGHEIAHCWWGNGVLVDDDAGNWSEALTTYVADYLYKEKKSSAEARAYRMQILRDYTTLVKPGRDFALRQFKSRYDPITKTIGYGKGAMVFHMLRKQLGENDFWGALRDLYRNRLFKATGWTDLQTAFEKRSDQSLQDFFDQWVFRKGAPQFYLDAVRSTRTGDSWTIEGRIVQQRPGFSFDLNLGLQNHAKTISKTIRVAGEKTRFRMVSGSRPLKLKADPDTDIFRRLFPEEMPPSINSLKSSASLLVLLADDLEPDIKRAARRLLLSLGVKNYTFSQERALDQKDDYDQDILMIGYPQRKERFFKLPQRVAINPQSFVVDKNIYDRPSDLFFGVFPHRHREDRVAALFLPLSSVYVEAVARKITHYGKYSYLVFRKESNRDKGFWSVGQSPLEYRWKYGNNVTSRNLTSDRKPKVD